MGLESVLKYVKSALEADGFSRRVFIYDYSKLNTLGEDYMAVIRFGGATDEPDTFGDSYVRAWSINVELYAGFYQSPLEAHTKLARAIDKAVLAIEKRVHLGRGAGSDIQSARVFALSPITEERGEEGTVNKLLSTLQVRVEETETVAAVE